MPQYKETPLQEQRGLFVWNILRKTGPAETKI